MNTRNRIVGTVAAAALLTTTAVTAGGHRPETFYIEAPVVDVRPLVEIVEVSTPREVCWNEEVERYVEEPARGPRTSTIVGTVLGAAIGNNIAEGRDRKSARIAGALLGGAIGRDVGRRNAHTRRVVTQERRCEVEHVAYEEERINGYRVTYRYEGREFVTRTERDPGETLRLRVSIAPIH